MLVALQIFLLIIIIIIIIITIVIIDSVSFKFKQKITGQAGNDDTKGVEIIAELKYLSNFRKPLEMPLFNCEICFMLSWSANCFLIAGTVANQEPRFRITVNI